MEICSSHYKEDLEWLQRSKYPVTVVTHEGGDPVPGFIEKAYKIPNVGFEASSYLAFIIKRMTTDSLPEYTAFIHGHEKSDHQLVDDILYEIENHPCAQFHHLNNNWVYKLTDDDDKFVDIEKFEKLIGPIPPVVWTCTSAQFIVHRDCIKRHPIEFYKTLFKNVKTKRDATSLEFLWHIIFGQPAIMRPPPGAFNMSSWLVPEPHKMVMDIKCEGDPPRFGYPLENIRKVDKRDTTNYNSVYVEIVGDRIKIHGNEFSISELFPIYLVILRNSVKMCPFKDEYHEYCKSQFEFVEGDILKNLFTLDRSRDHLMCVDVRNPKNEWALNCFTKWYGDEVRVVLYDEVVFFLVTKHEPTEPRLNLEHVVVDGEHLKEE